MGSAAIGRRKDGLHAVRTGDEATFRREMSREMDFLKEDDPDLPAARERLMQALGPLDIDAFEVLYRAASGPSIRVDAPDGSPFEDLFWVSAWLY